MLEPQNIHATTVSVEQRGVVLRGPSGSGKSALALRLIDAGAALVADDRTIIRHDGGMLVASPPDELAGLMEVRGLGIIRLHFEKSVDIALLVDLCEPDDVDRLPQTCHETFMGVRVRHMRLCAADLAAVAKIRLAAILTDQQMIEPT